MAIKLLLGIPAIHDRHKESYAHSELEKQKQLDMTRLQNSQWCSRWAAKYSLFSSNHHSWIKIGWPHVVLVYCSSHPGAGPQHIASAASQGMGRTPCTSWFTPWADSCFCTYICIHTNIKWGAQIQSTVTSSPMLSLVYEGFQRREKY